jgi:hypothetical protein
VGLFDFAKEKAGDMFSIGGANSSSQDMYSGKESELGMEWGSVQPSAWYKTFPYQIVVSFDDSASLGILGGLSATKPPHRFVYTLPIPPESLSYRMIPASNVSATIGGVVEEVSATVFWSINIAGTTGMAVTRSGEDEPDRTVPASVFRDYISTTGLLAGANAAIAGAFNKVRNVLGAVGTGNIGTIAGAAALPQLPYARSAVQGGKNTNGYTELHELQKFLYAYAALREQNPSKYKMYFINHKDQQQLQVSLRDFSWQKSVSEPYLYRYRIAFQGWEPTKPDPKLGAPTDRYKGDLKSVNTLTITGMASAAGKLLGTIQGGPKNIAGALGVIPPVI